ncbi:MAG: SCP2 domain-containing protein [Candidatus Thioglobus sp.]|nr:SCP2 domain-containing protein [Candidatus Thioglobus sp.]
MRLTHSVIPSFLPVSALLQTAKSVNNKIIIALFNKVFSQAIKDGDLDFLEDQWVLIEVNDIGLAFNLSLKHRQLVQTQYVSQFDLTINANSCDFLDLISKRKDPDTLFFQRKIKMRGSTELGLHVKNFLDAFETDTHWLSAGMDKVLKKTYPVLSKLLCKNS